MPNKELSEEELKEIERKKKRKANWIIFVLIAIGLIFFSILIKTGFH